MSRDCARIRDPFTRRAFERAERKERLLAFLDRGETVRQQRLWCVTCGIVEPWAIEAAPASLV